MSPPVISRKSIALLSALAVFGSAIFLLLAYDYWQLPAGFPGAKSSAPRGSSSVNHSDPVAHQAFKDELVKAGIPYTLTTRDGKEFVVWTPQYYAAVDEIQRRLAPIPVGLSASFDDPAQQEAYKQWLLKRGIPFQVSVHRGREFVVWKEGDENLPMQFMRERPASCPERTSAIEPATAKQKRC